MTPTKKPEVEKIEKLVKQIENRIIEKYNTPFGFIPKGAIKSITIGDANIEGFRKGIKAVLDIIDEIKIKTKGKVGRKTQLS